MQIISERRQCEKAHTVCFPRLHMTFWKRQNYGDSEKKKSSGFQGLEGRKDEETEHRECLGKRNNSAWYYNSGYIVKTNRGYKTKSKLM